MKWLFIIALFLTLSLTGCGSGSNDAARLIEVGIVTSTDSQGYENFDLVASGSLTGSNLIEPFRLLVDATGKTTNYRFRVNGRDTPAWTIYAVESLDTVRAAITREDGTKKSLALYRTSATSARLEIDDKPEAWSVDLRDWYSIEYSIYSAIERHDNLRLSRGVHNAVSKSIAVMAQIAYDRPTEK